MSAGYAWEKLHTAVLILAQGSRPLRRRLEDAYISSLIRLHPEEDFPDLDARDRFNRFNTLMDEIAPNGRLGFEPSPPTLARCPRGLRHGVRQPAGALSFAMNQIDNSHLNRRRYPALSGDLPPNAWN